jgi:hypothetical protein
VILVSLGGQTTSDLFLAAGGHVWDTMVLVSLVRKTAWDLSYLSIYRWPLSVKDDGRDESAEEKERQLGICPRVCGRRWS